MDVENFELALGIAGPGALGEQVPNDFHQFIATPTAKGWGSQLQTEFGAVLSYERKWRQPLAGILLCIGKGLGADYGPARIRPALSGTDFDERGLDDGRALYFFLGAQGRAVARSIFLDGNSYRASRSVPKKNLVGDVQAGFSASWSKSLRLDLSVVLRSKEFRGQRTSDYICTAALTFAW